MLVLLPPSETKHPGGDGAPLDLTTLSAPELTPVRTELIETLVKLAGNEPASRTALGLSPNQDDEIARNAALWTSPTSVSTRSVRTGVSSGADIAVRSSGAPSPPGRLVSDGGSRTSTGRQVTCRRPSTQARSTITGAWSLAPLPLRSSRSISAPVVRAASAGDPSTKSIRMPSRRGNRSRT